MIFCFHLRLLGAHSEWIKLREFQQTARRTAFLLWRMLNRPGFIQVAWRAYGDKHDRPYSVVRDTFYAIDAFFLDGDGALFIQLAFDRERVFGQHPIYALGIVGLVSWNEGYGITG
jgi:hypothetical protein